MKYSFHSLFILAFMLKLAACQSDSTNQQETKQDNKDFYPVRAYFTQELKELDSLPVAVFLYRESTLDRDTTIVDKSEFRRMVEKLSLPDITIDPLKKKYRETVYMDNTLNLITLSYSTDDPALEIQKIDVYVSPETDRVKNIYMEKRSASGDSTILQKMVWTSGKQFQVTRIITAQGQEEKIMQEKYSWAMPH
jgi:hypothetical protein